MAIQKISNAVIADNAIDSDNLASGAVTAADITDGTITAAKLDTSDNYTVGGIVSSGKIVVDGDTSNLSGGVGLEIIGRDGSSGVGYINYVTSQGGNRLAAIGVPSVDEELVFDLFNRSNDTTYGRKLRLTNGASYFDDEDVYADGKKMTTDNKALAISLVFGG